MDAIDGKKNKIQSTMPEEIKKFECQICEKYFENEQSLKTHIESVHEGIKFQCEICGKEYSDKSNLKRHISSVHKCKICEKNFT